MMNRVFKAKVSWWLFAPILIMISTIMIVQWRSSLLGGISSLLALAFVVHLVVATSYTITPETVFVQCGFFRWQIPTQRITRITETHNPLSSPAPSLDRLNISYNKYDNLMISPRHKQDFIDVLRQLNPTIQVG